MTPNFNKYREIKLYIKSQDLDSEGLLYNSIRNKTHSKINSKGFPFVSKHAITLLNVEYNIILLCIKYDPLIILHIDFIKKKNKTLVLFYN